MARQGAFGICQSCGARESKGAMFPHLQECLPTQVGRGPRGGPEALLLLRAEARGLSTFWLDMAVRHDAKLKDVDGFLRRTWLEWCGHMSEFSTGRTTRSP